MAEIDNNDVKTLVQVAEGRGGTGQLQRDGGQRCEVKTCPGNEARQHHPEVPAGSAGDLEWGRCENGPPHSGGEAGVQGAGIL